MTQNRFLSLLVFYFAGLHLQYAQTIASSNCSPTFKKGTKFAYGSSQTFSPGPAGAHQIWDFTNYTFQTNYIDTFDYPSPNYVNFFPNADFARYVNSTATVFYKYVPAGIEKVGDLSVGLVTYI